MRKANANLEASGCAHVSSHPERTAARETGSVKNKRNTFRRRYRLLLSATLIAGTLPLSAQMPGMAPPKHYAWSDPKMSPDERADLVVKQLTLDEKVQLLHGIGWDSMFGGNPNSGPGTRAITAWEFIPGIPRLGIPDLQMSDDLSGVSLQGVRGRYATAFPPGIVVASTWDLSLAARLGATIGGEMRALGFNMSLGTGVNLTREPRDGRASEYSGEDPILAGLLVGQKLKAEKAQHLVTDIKHYAVNDQDNGREYVNSVIDKRSLRETDLLAFQIGIRDSDASTVMCSYNKVNGTYACENDYLLNQVLKKEFNFKGFVVADWGATHSTVKAAQAGLDVQMPSGNLFGEPLKIAVEKGEVPQARLNDMVHRVLRSEFDSGIFDNPPQQDSPDVFKGFEVAQEVEEKGIVLLKNSDKALPLRAADVKSIAVIGGHADAGVLSSSGASQVFPAGGNAITPGQTGGGMMALFQPQYHHSVPLKGISAKVPGASVRFDAGTDVASAVALAKSSQVAIVFALQHRAEGSDVANLSLPDNQDALIEAVAKANPHTIVVLETGGAITMPWIDKVQAVVEAWYPGIRGSEAIANVLFGDVNPSGKLPITFAQSEADLPHPKPSLQPSVTGTAPPPGLDVLAVPGFPVNTMPFDAVYDEGLKLGYKWFDAENKTPLFPFGFEMSYTDYYYSNLKVTQENGVRASFRVKNIGKRSGEEIAEVYLFLPANANEPPKRLIGWKKLTLAPGEEKDFTVQAESLFLSLQCRQGRLGDRALWIHGTSRWVFP